MKVINNFCKRSSCVGLKKRLISTLFPVCGTRVNILQSETYFTFFCEIHFCVLGPFPS